jgi:hypothetical protein
MTSRNYLGFALILLIAACHGACASFNRSPLPKDFVQNGDCVANQILAGVTGVAQVEAACLPGQLQSVADLVDYLLRGDFGKAHPDKVAAMQEMRVQAARLGETW